MDQDLAPQTLPWSGNLGKTLEEMFGKGPKLEVGSCFLKASGGTRNKNYQ